MTVRAPGNNNDPPEVVPPTRLEFQITRHKIVRSGTFRTIKIGI